ncbi:hypothetical protein CS063_07075 [Sporanaerobium hydrogeniformans]|uniref:Uncharacterized protein n=1 Tax=Sporanaerobium hydrogeniformans TaxID=3072179 RepID=A0AC61DD03_9FIRM|nr:penicillin-binding transpeptidase domain-containing protein [Sporanaerobium hydrogeniformans]PHV71086.1 hypothetical protein CS063_07075 [Sporanaerobium hydrogeniformans]
MERRQQSVKKNQNTLSKTRLNRRIFIIALFFIVFIIYMIYQVTYIKFIHGEEYQKQVYSRLMSRESPINPQRGNILDRNNNTLATSFLTYDITLSPKEIMEEEETDRYVIYEALAEAVDKKAEEIQALVEKNPSSQYALLAKNVANEKVEVLKEKKINGKALTGVWYDKSFIRSYPKSELAAQLLGFYNKDGQGQYGIEQQYNEYLVGEAGRIFSQFQDEQIITTEMKAVENGANIRLTIDEVIQQYVETTMKKYIKEYNPVNAAAIIANPNTGEIYSMYSYPSFDPNHYNNLEEQLGKEVWNGLNEQDKTTALYSAWRNFTTQNPYELGSTFKPLLIALAIDEHAIDLNDTYLCHGSMQVADRLIHCWKTSGHGEQTVEQALANSCNMAMIQIAEKIDYDLFLSYMDKYGFGERTGIALPGEETGLLHNKLGPVERATYSMGQTFTATPVQLISAFSAVINGGYLLEPLVVSDIVDERGEVLYHAKPVIRRQVISKETSELVRRYLGKVVDEGGTGVNAHISGYKIGGKTGTAEKGERGNEKYIVSFVGYAPLENPEVIALVIFDEAPEKSGAPTKAFKEMMGKILPYLQIETTSNMQETKEEQGEVPSLIGKNLYEATSLLQAQGLTYQSIGVGTQIKSQYPKEGTLLPKGSSVRLYMQAENPGALLEVPNLIGMSIEQAQSLVGEDFTLSGNGSGEITNQVPKAGAKIEKKAQIVVQTYQ